MAAGVGPKAAAEPGVSYPCLAAGVVLGGGRYVVVREINRGGAAVVYEAVDREMQIAVAIKAVIMDVRTRDAQVRGGRAPFLLPTQGARIDHG